MPVDKTSFFSRELSDPFTGAEAVTPDDDTDLDILSRALWIGTEGDITVVLESGTEATFTDVRGWFPGRVSRVKATGTTALNIVSVW